MLDTLSATDFCLQLRRRVSRGEQLLVITQLSHAFLLLRGKVTEVHKKAGSYSLSLNIQQHQIFSLTGGTSLTSFYEGDSHLAPSQMNDGPVSLEFDSETSPEMFSTQPLAPVRTKVHEEKE